MEEFEKTCTPSHSRKQSAEESNVKENMHRDDLLEGAENIPTEVVSEVSESNDPLMCSLSTRPLPEVSIETEGEGLLTSVAGTKVSDAAKSTSQSQKRSVAVRDLPKGIYVTNTESTGKNLRTTNETVCLEPLETRDGQKKKTLGQFPLLQDLMGSGFRTNAQSQKF